MKKLILASASRRRFDMLKNAGYEFDVCVADVDENSISNKGLSPQELVMKLAFMKASKVLKNQHENTVVVAADTIVYFNGRIFGKPENKSHAFRTLKELSGNTHHVYTGAYIAESHKDTGDNFWVSAAVTMSEMKDYEIENYVNTGLPMDKSGCYGIQGVGALFIKEIHGDFFAIEGLPINRVYNSLKKFDIIPEFENNEYI